MQQRLMSQVAVDQGRDGTQFGHAQPGEHELGTIGHEDAHNVTSLQSNVLLHNASHTVWTIRHLKKK